MNLPIWIGRIVCALRGHRHGRRVNYAGPENLSVLPNEYWLRCPRCGAKWTHKKRKPK